MGLQGRQMKLECQFFLQISLTNPKSKGYKNVGKKIFVHCQELFLKLARNVF
jgi:hypothetical protein